MQTRNVQVWTIHFRKAGVAFGLVSVFFFCFTVKAQDTVFNYNPSWTSYYLIQDPDVVYVVLSKTFANTKIKSLSKIAEHGWL